MLLFQAALPIYQFLQKNKFSLILSLRNDSDGGKFTFLDLPSFSMMVILLIATSKLRFSRSSLL